MCLLFSKNNIRRVTCQFRSLCIGQGLPSGNPRVELCSMEQTVCARCGRRKATRFCPALGQGLCSLCCGRGRLSTIDCPEGCRFWRESRQQALKRLVTLAGGTELEVTRFAPLHDFRLALVKFRRRFQRRVADEDVLEGLNNAIESLQVRSRGLIYDFRSPNPDVQQLTDALLQVADWYQHSSNESLRMGIGELLECLRYLRGQLRAVIKKRTDFWVRLEESIGSRFIVQPVNKQGGKEKGLLHGL